MFAVTSQKQKTERERERKTNQTPRQMKKEGEKQAAG